MVCDQIEAQVIELFGISHVVPLHNVFEENAFKQSCHIAFGINVLKEHFRITSLAEILAQKVQNHTLPFLCGKSLIYDKISCHQKFRKRKRQQLKLNIATCQMG